MLLGALLFFALAAILGLYLLSYILTEKNTPKGVAIIHGSIAACGIILLIIYSFLYQSPLASLIIFILAAAGGFLMFFWDIIGKKIPKFLAIGHGSLAILGFVLLLWFVYNHYAI
ncbi:hypothetical protein [Legionella cardiaca]|uniref:Transmembrane protein n=1 Tax=Legionella cardiaca TaxID=1071983 RepID=A0ABY8ATK1_9GAMM|nr:hypothetical protein [Legionella cardiaca]WED43998.1 hypothetical protein PXX05_04220 [Legionella cardiaca]